MSKDRKYKQLQENVRVLTDSYGSSVVVIRNPADMEKTLTVRKNSENAKEYLETFQLMLYEYDVLMLELRKKKESLRKKLF